MSYYIIPKNNNIFTFEIIDKNITTHEPYISHSLHYYYYNVYQEIQTICHYNLINDLSFNNYENMISLVHSYEYIYSNVPGSNYSVSKLKSRTNLFYDLLEILNTLNSLNYLKNKKNKCLHISPNYNDSIYCFELLKDKDNKDDEILFCHAINNEIKHIIQFIKFDFLFFETNTDNLQTYVHSFLEYLNIILNNQEINGFCIIKINHIFHKIIVDILFILSSLYEKIYIIKPNSNNSATFEKYIVCKNFQIIDKIIKENYDKLSKYLKNIDINNINNINIYSLINFDIPYYFISKINDINNTIGQQQLQTLDQIINILKNKNKEDKIENIKKINILKSVNWCEKYKIPCNKFYEKTNIFLPIK
jgi:hypothetical protein